MSYLRTLTIALACAAVSLAGCGDGRGGGGPPPVITTQIVSDSALDGNIGLTPPNSFVVVQGMSPTVQSVFAGTDPVTLTEFRTFLDFPLTGINGVPGNAVIDSAFLDIYVYSLQPNTGTISILIELVSFQPPPLLATDFDRTIQPPLAFTSVVPPFSQADIGTNVSIDVTSLMVTAQRLGLPDFQVRILQDFVPSMPALLEIDDTTGPNRPALAPVLTVNYF